LLPSAPHGGSLAHNLRYLIAVHVVHQELMAGRKTLVFSSSVHALDVLLRYLVAFGLQYPAAVAVIHGGTPIGERERIAARFNAPTTTTVDASGHDFNAMTDSQYDDTKPDDAFLDACDAAQRVKYEDAAMPAATSEAPPEAAADLMVLLASTQACGVGLALHGARRIIFLDPPESPAIEAQLLCRAYRLGQLDQPLHALRLVAPDEGRIPLGRAPVMVPFNTAADTQHDDPYGSAPMAAPSEFGIAQDLDQRDPALGAAIEACAMRLVDEAPFVLHCFARAPTPAPNTTGLSRLGAARPVATATPVLAYAYDGDFRSVAC
jgi:hypothetical protein